MPKGSKSTVQEKEGLHARNKHRNRYDFESLIKSCPELGDYVSINKFNDLSVDFTNPEAVKTLNKALLKHFYQIDLWDIPEGYLCPPVPGRADYIHYMADLLAETEGSIPKGKSIKVLDVGTGANCIYPLIGHKEYGWSFIGSEIDHIAIRAAKNLVEANSLGKFISIRKQDPDKILEGIIHLGEKFHFTMCNPPFHDSREDAAKSTENKWRKLGKEKQTYSDLNFGGKNTELWCEGGEQRFVNQMIKESISFSKEVIWFSSLISKKETLAGCYKELEKAGASEVRTIGMSQGQKVSRILAWTYQTERNNL